MTQIGAARKGRVTDLMRRLAKAEGKSLSEVVRDLLEEYVKNRDISAHIDGLWTRIGEKLRRKGVTLESIDGVIREVRRPANDKNRP